MKLFFSLAGLFVLLLLVGSLVSAATQSERFDPVDYARAEALEPVYRLALVIVVVGVPASLVGALGVALLKFFRSARYAMPRGDGLLPVPLDDLASVAPQALGAWHAARQLEAQQQPVPHTITYHAPHYRGDGRGDAAAPAALAAPAAPALPGLTDLAALAFRPSREAILLGLAEGGQQITVPAKALCHVALVGATGGGKSNLLRLILPQLQAIGARVVLADPHFAPLDPESGDDWRPIAARLHLAPAVTAPQIADLLGYLLDELDQRLARRRRGEPVGAPLFFAFDELPVIADTVPGSIDMLGKIVREGRKVHLLAVGASQTMLVKAIGGDSSIRDSYRTAFYVGGDLKSASALLDMRQADIAESELHTGVAYLRSSATSSAQIVRVPLASNRAIVDLLGIDEASDQASEVTSETRPIGFRTPPLAEARWKPDGSLRRSGFQRARTRRSGARARALPARPRYSPNRARAVRDRCGRGRAALPERCPRSPALTTRSPGRHLMGCALFILLALAVLLAGQGADLGELPLGFLVGLVAGFMVSLGGVYDLGWNGHVDHAERRDHAKARDAAERDRR